MKKIFAGVGVLILAAGLWLVAFQQQAIKDHYIARTAPLSSEMQAIHDNLDLTEQGSLLFRASRPQLLEADDFNTACHQIHKELSIVLGCYAAQRFYVYNVDDPRLRGIQEVTAAHELLHAVYERLSEEERATVNASLEHTARAIQDERFQETVEAYRQAGPEHVNNELHSILGSEIAVLPSELEAHYARYFKDRTKIVAYAAAYESAFIEIEESISDFDEQLADYTRRKEQLELSLGVQQQELATQREEMARARASGAIEEYNRQVPVFNQGVRQYNQDIATLQSIIRSYNEVVQKRNALAMSQRELMQQMDSTYEPLE